MEEINLGLFRAARRNRHMDMKQASAVIGKDKNAIYRYESGITSPRLDDFLMLLEAYHVKVNDVLSERSERT